MLTNRAVSIMNQCIIDREASLTCGLKKGFVDVLVFVLVIENLF